MTRALFLDRDGVINVEKDYLFKIEDFEFIDDTIDLCLHYQQLGYLLFVITNQAGIARGYYTVNDFNKLTDWMLNELKQKGVNITKVYFCPHHPQFSGPCDCRKPAPGMLLQAAREFNIDLPNSVLIGDKESDMEAGRKAGILTLIKR
jgi:D-glycero-D-manno-heptose 1,7-bisphosphate phosphatase